MNDSEDDLNISAPRNLNFRFIKPSPFHPSPDLTVDKMELGSEDNTNEGRRGSSRRSSPFLGEKSEDTMVASSRRSSPSLSSSTLNYGDDETNNLKKIDADLRIGVASKSTSRPRVHHFPPFLIFSDRRQSSSTEIFGGRRKFLYGQRLRRALANSKGG